MRARLVIAFVLAAVAAATAQQLPEIQPRATGTGAIAGRVVEAGNNTPVAGARLWLHQTRGETSRGVYPRSEHSTTDSSGAFAFRNLPAGQFSIQAYMDGFQEGAMGRRRPEGDEAWITLKAGQSFSEARIELFRGGTISGVVTNERGEPMNKVGIGTWRRTRSGELKRGASGSTDATGAYRLTATEPGDHLVIAHVWHDTRRQGPPVTEPNPCVAVLPQPRGTPAAPLPKPKYAVGEWFATLPRSIPEPSADDQGKPRTIATTFYPGVAEVSQALTVRIGNGEERAGIDLQLRPTATTIVQGTVVPLQGQSIGRGSEVRLRLPEAPEEGSEHRTWVEPDNTFRFIRVPPGSYVLELQPQEWISCDVTARRTEDVVTLMPLTVPPTGLDDLVVSVAAGTTMHARIRFDGKTPRPANMDIRLAPVFGDDTKPGSWDDDAQIIADGLIPGGYALQVLDNALEAQWFVRSMKLGARDLVTRPLEIKRENVSGVEVTMTDRPSPLYGQVKDASGRPVRDATVVVFPVDRSTWAAALDALSGLEGTRSLDGTYRFDHLVPGDYLVAAVDERRMGDWPRAEFLEAVARQASPVRIAYGEPRTLQLLLRVIPETRRN